MDCTEKLRDCFDEMVVYKDLKKTNFFSALSLPSFMRDWLLKKFEDEDGAFDKDSECPFCELQKKLDAEIMDYILGPSYMEEDIREQTNKLGFCNGRFAQTPSRLCRCLIYILLYQQKVLHTTPTSSIIINFL